MPVSTLTHRRTKSETSRPTADTETELVNYLNIPNCYKSTNKIPTPNLTLHVRLKLFNVRNELRHWIRNRKREIQYGGKQPDGYNIVASSLASAIFDSDFQIALSLCLPRCALWSKGAREAYSVYRNRIRMWWRHFDWYYFRRHRSTLTPQSGSNWGAIIWHWNSGLRASDMVNIWEVLGSRGWASIGTNRNAKIQQLGILKLPYKLQSNGSRWSNTWTDRRCEVIARSCKHTNIFSGFAFDWLKYLSSTSAAIVSQLYGLFVLIFQTSK